MMDNILYAVICLCVNLIIIVIYLFIENRIIEKDNREYKRMIMDYIIMDLKKLKEEQEYDDEEEEEE